jgi:hypothetical protein
LNSIVSRVTLAEIVVLFKSILSIQDLSLKVTVDFVIDCEISHRLSPNNYNSCNDSH